MQKIRTKENTKGTIKTIDKTVIGLEKLKDSIVHTKEKSDITDESNIIDYGSNVVAKANDKTVSESVYQFNKLGKHSVVKTKDNIKNVKEKIQKNSNEIKIRKIEKKDTKELIKSNKVIKKNIKQISTQPIKSKQKISIVAKNTVKKAKVISKATISSIKAILAGTKALISALIAGGWIAVIVIIIICLVGLLCSSIFGIFLSSANSGNTFTLNSVINEINGEMATKIKNIQDTNIHDDYVITSNRSDWKEVLALYSVKISNGDNSVDVITLDETKKEELKKIFWDMHNITFEIREELSDIYLDNNLKRILYINVSSSSLDEMLIRYGMSFVQKQQLQELLNSKYDLLWTSIILGTPVGSPDMVQVALSQVGNIGGELYWRWYGFDTRVEWCAIFVSWVAEQLGLIEKGVFPKFAGCETGINWFKVTGQWKEKNYIPKPGDIIFFDWETDGTVSHVGIVEKVENEIIYTIEGNSNDDMCRQKQYSIDSQLIFGYGVPFYS